MLQLHLWMRLKAVQPSFMGSCIETSGRELANCAGVIVLFYARQLWNNDIVNMIASTCCETLYFGQTPAKRDGWLNVWTNTISDYCKHIVQMSCRQTPAKPHDE